ncbi:hypothetical protein OSTOST_10010 [Ostertagia ostertagi]
MKLLIRKKLNDVYKNHGEKVPEMSVKQGILQIGPRFVIKPAICAIRLGLSLPEWQGLSFTELLSESEKEEYSRGIFKQGDISFSVLLKLTKGSEPTDMPESREVTKDAEERRVVADIDDSSSTTKRKRTHVEEDGDVNPLEEGCLRCYTRSLFVL